VVGSALTSYRCMSLIRPVDPTGVGLRPGVAALATFTPVQLKVPACLLSLQPQ
jgi:hypothetical protein